MPDETLPDEIGYTNLNLAKIVGFYATRVGTTDYWNVFNDSKRRVGSIKREKCSFPKCPNDKFTVLTNLGYTDNSKHNSLDRAVEWFVKNEGR